MRTPLYPFINLLHCLVAFVIDQIRTIILYIDNDKIKAPFSSIE